MPSPTRIEQRLSAFARWGPLGPVLRAVSGIFEHRNAADTAYAIARGAAPVGADDLVTLGFAGGAYAPIGASYIVVANDATLTAERRF